MTLTFLGRCVAVLSIIVMAQVLVLTTGVNSLVLPKPTTILTTRPRTNHRYRDYIQHINRLNENRRHELNHKIISTILSGGK
jgi:hypothetical protein